MLVLTHLEGYRNLDIPDEFRKYLIWQKGYYAPHLHNGKFNMPPPLDIECTKMISLLQDLKEADFSDVRMAKINVELMKLTEVCGFSKQNQNNLHDFLLTYVDATHKSELLTPAARNLLAEQSDRKGLKFTTYYLLLKALINLLYLKIWTGISLSSSLLSLTGTTKNTSRKRTKTFLPSTKKFAQG